MNELQYWKSKAEALESLINHYQLRLHRDIMEFEGIDRHNKSKLKESQDSLELSKKVISGQS